MKFQSAVSIGCCSLLLVAYLQVSCGRSEKQDGFPQTSDTPSLINFAQLVEECKNLAEEGKESGVDRWSSDGELPTVVASLSPQVVRLSVFNEATVIDIQISGGFSHEGYLVVCSSTDPDFVPVTGRNWRITKVFSNVFEYRE